MKLNKALVPFPCMELEGTWVTFSLEVLVGLDEARDERPRERGEPLVPAQIGGDAAEHVAEEVLLGVHRGGAAVVPVEQLGRGEPDSRAAKRLRTRSKRSSIGGKSVESERGDEGAERLRRRRRRRWTARRGGARRRA